MRLRLIWLGLKWLEWLGYDLPRALRELREELRRTKVDLENLQVREANRRGRSAVLHEMINGLVPVVAELDNAPQSSEWKRHKLECMARKRYPAVSSELTDLAADYARYYYRHEHLSPEREVLNP